jgi:hypothetical protein
VVPHVLAARSTDAYEAAREKVRRFLGAGSPNDIVFARGATEAINLVAQAWGRRNVREGDEIVITWLYITPILYRGKCSAPIRAQSYGSLRSMTAAR